MTCRFTVLISLFLGLLCIEVTFARSRQSSKSELGDDTQSLSKWSNKNGDSMRSPAWRNNNDEANTKSQSESSSVRRDDTDTSDFTVNAFSNILHNTLENSEILTSLLLNPVDAKLIVSIATNIAESFVLEVGLVDSFLATELIIEALFKVKPGMGLEAYCTALTDVTANILSSNSILNSENYFTLANTVGRVVLDAASVSLNELNDANNTKKDTSVDLETASKTDLDVDTAVGLDFDTDAAADSDFITDIGSDVLNGGLTPDNLDQRSDAGVDTNFNADVNSLLNVDANVGLPLETNLNFPTVPVVNFDLSVSEEAILQFKSELATGLLKDNNFKYVFSDYVPPNALRYISAAVCQYISKAFAVSRSFLLPLENSIGNLPLDSTPCPELYANIITETLKNLFVKANFITKSTASLQAIIAVNAITSGIANFMRISVIPGVKLNINENAFNSYFSILNGLEKLPYVGVEAASPNLPLAIKLSYASTYASKFSKILFYNLISSKKFLEIISLGVPSFINKITVEALGNCMAEAFGSPNTNLFYDLYSKALLTPFINSNCANYVRALSLATGKGLFLNGYFLSGNINIQAAIAKDAIIRALSTTKTPDTTQVTLFPNILGLPLITQLEGVSPTEILLKYATDIGLNIGTNSGSGLGVDQTLNQNINTVLGAGVNVNSALGTGVNVNNGLGTGLGTNVGLGAGLGANVDLGTGLGTNVGLGTGLGTNVGLGTGLGTNVGLGTGLGTNVGLGARLGANIGLGAGLRTNVGLGAGVVTNSDLGNALSVESGLGGIVGENMDLGGRGIGSNVDVGGGLIRNNGLKSKQNVLTSLNMEKQLTAGLGEYLGSSTGLGGGLGANAGLGGVGANAGLEGVGGNVLLGGVDANVGLEKGLGANNILVGGLGTNSDLGGEIYKNAGLDRGFGANVNLGRGFGPGVNSAGGMGSNIDLGTRQDINAVLQQNLGANADLIKRLNTNTDFGAAAGLNVLGAGQTMNAGVSENDAFGGNIGLIYNGNLENLKMEQNGGLSRYTRKKRSTDNLDSQTFQTSITSNTLESISSRARVNAGFTATTVQAALITGTGSSNTQMSIANVLPLILANKLYQSTALCTSISIVGTRKIVSLISQAIAGEFGLPIATVFLRSYDQFFLNNPDNSFEISMVGLAKATTEALAGIGILNSAFSVSVANQLADAVVSKFSSLIATSLEIKDNTIPKWTYLMNQEVVQPPLISGYNTFK